MDPLQPTARGWPGKGSSNSSWDDPLDQAGPKGWISPEGPCVLGTGTGPGTVAHPLPDRKWGRTGCDSTGGGGGEGGGKGVRGGGMFWS